MVQIADAAGCSVGGFYARFPGGRDALYELLERRMFEESIACWREFFSSPRRGGQALGAMLGDLVDLLLRRYREDRALLRELLLHWRREPPTEGVREAAERQREVLEGLLTDALTRRRRAFRHPDPGHAAGFVLDLLQSLLTEHVLFGEGPSHAAEGPDGAGGPTGRDPDGLRENLVHAILGVLDAARPEPGREEGTG